MKAWIMKYRPDRKINPFALMAWEYGPIAEGDNGVEITILSADIVVIFRL